MTFFAMPTHRILRAFAVATALLLIPIGASFFVDGWLWTGSDYAFAWVVFAVVGLAYAFVASKGYGAIYKLASALALATAFLLVFVSGAVAIIGKENPGNLLYLCVLAIGFFGAIIARFTPRGMALVLFAVAIAQLSVPTIAYMFWPVDFSPGVTKVFMLNAAFAMLFAGAGLLFRQASLVGKK